MADALRSGRSPFTRVEVQVLSSAPLFSSKIERFFPSPFSPAFSLSRLFFRTGFEPSRASTRPENKHARITVGSRQEKGLSATTHSADNTDGRTARKTKKGKPAVPFRNRRLPDRFFRFAADKVQRSTRAPPPPTSFSTSARRAMEVSPGVVMASAPCAAPYSTASAGSPFSMKP